MQRKLVVVCFVGLLLNVFHSFHFHSLFVLFLLCVNVCLCVCLFGVCVCVCVLVSWITKCKNCAENHGRNERRSPNWLLPLRGNEKRKIKTKAKNSVR